eukprot:8711953-Lingulodinium_polyedra.AAC.1
MAGEAFALRRGDVPDAGRPQRVALCFAAFGCGYNGEILPFGERALFKVPAGHSRQVAAGVQQRTGDG